MDIGDSQTSIAVGASSLDEDLREASAQGDADRVASLLAAGADVRSANRVNGWTALHWAAKRGHSGVASLLLGRGADVEARNNHGETPGELAGSQKLARMLLGDAGKVTLPLPVASTPSTELRGGSVATTSAFVPNYLRHPEFPYAKPAPAAVAGGDRARSAEGLLQLQQLQQQQQRQQQKDQPLLLQARVADCGDPDFIELELQSRTYDNLLDLLCQELSLDPSSVERIRKLPNVRLRNDRDVDRLEHGQQLEVVLMDI